MGWLRQCALLYFLDKHDCYLPSLEELAGSGVLHTVAQGLVADECLYYSEQRGRMEIGPEGRRFIGRLLAETEDCIDRYDLFRDVAWDEDTEAWDFDSGYGDDLRVEVYIAEGLDPVRAVFLLRLYDGSLDRFAAVWPDLLGDANFFNHALEPVVNRDLALLGAIHAIIEDGYACLELRASVTAQARAREQTAARLRQSFGDPPRNAGPA